jgi:hypothetical protein
MGEGIKEGGRGDEFKCDIFTQVRTCVNAIMCPHPSQQ